MRLEKPSLKNMAEHTYKVTVRGFDSGLNELLRGVRYDPKTRRVINPVKSKNDRVCMDALRFENLHMRGIKLKPPLVMHYKFYCKDKRRDRSNIQAGFVKSFEDALQKMGIIPNDGWNEVVGITSDFTVDAKNPRVVVVIHEVEAEPKTMWKGWEFFE